MSTPACGVAPNNCGRRAPLIALILFSLMRSDHRVVSRDVSPGNSRQHETPDTAGSSGNKNPKRTSLLEILATHPVHEQASMYHHLQTSTFGIQFNPATIDLWEFVCSIGHNAVMFGSGWSKVMDMDASACVTFISKEHGTSLSTRLRTRIEVDPK
ncbi:hypothetical protein F5B22DRAFT_239514 [Xylaria bambusicola]|uniref:uncharacterized protein n=1 Tax=Xylaria bambusicola TaxID=326684 RepID=UPI002008D24E|nr:uncharacterized protein F5B22DRAFT_239514 [Xylaria bambusicola]KAI0514403.1 hypothetical protein F5B22DRAFT_239514 [Xylaria bambusicola]